MQPHFFATPAELRRWFRAHQKQDLLWVGYHRKATGRPSISWQESVDEALCVGWIDGIRKRIDGERFQIRFTPRRKGSVWSAVNIARVQALQAEGRMLPAGLAAFAARRDDRSRIYAYEQRTPDLPPPYRGLFERHATAWEFFQAQPPYYRKQMTWWITSAKQEATRARRLEKLIEVSAKQLRL